MKENRIIGILGGLVSPIVFFFSLLIVWAEQFLRNFSTPTSVEVAFSFIAPILLLYSIFIFIFSVKVFLSTTGQLPIRPVYSVYLILLLLLSLRLLVDSPFN